jgi:drug/metabolite transporter (DMT)-like permease
LPAAFQARPDRTVLGVTLIVTAVFMMSIQEALFKQFGAELSLWQIFTLRGLLALQLLFIVALMQGQRRDIWASALRKWPLLRSLFMTMMFIAIYAAIPFLSLSTIAAGIYTGPVFVTLLSAYAIGEPVGTRGWIAIAMGFTGVLVILQPGTDAFTFWTVLPVFGGFLYALSNVTTRSKCQGIPTAALALSLNLALLLTGVVLSAVMLFWQPAGELVDAYPFLFSAWSEPGASEWVLIALLAALVVAIGMGLAGAYQSARPSIVATFDYSYLVFMVIWDYLLFSTEPAGTTISGILLIIAAGLLVIRRRT